MWGTEQRARREICEKVQNMEWGNVTPGEVLSSLQDVGLKWRSSLFEIDFIAVLVSFLEALYCLSFWGSMAED